MTTTRCVEDCGNTLTFTEAPVVDFTLTVHLTSGANITTTIDPKRIGENIMWLQESVIINIHIIVIVVVIMQQYIKKSVK